MARNDKHHNMLQFIKRIVDVSVDYSKDDLRDFRRVALRDYPSMVRLIDDYIQLIAKSDIESRNAPRTAKVNRNREDTEQMHLFDLLRQRRLFPSNTDLSEFAARVLPNMSRHRFDKMSRGDIAARIIEFLETRDAQTRKDLEASMRDAMNVPEKNTDRKSFLSKWEKIIRGIQL